ncbi:prenyltransferase/squalene oxidase repeat-containing protein [Catenulispora pinisilvae]|uniref:prenyltransferase/squalene oxidase repeat-containing protein n=1 Tax=Catenulispora pinisilvae TaxID=2705253 RepID=UPI001E31A8D2|nr:prenyltransferase/squalene oxidase repeat-containing protein [Catenulispora pinisilvae]
MTDRPWSDLSPSVYETGRLVSLAPWLTGHRARIAYLLESQRPDGGWGQSADGYGLVPTLSAAEALLNTLLADPAVASVADQASVLLTVRRALANLFAVLRPGAVLPIPDTPAIEIIVASLVSALNNALDRLPHSAVSGLDAWRGNGRLHLPSGVDDTVLTRMRSLLETGSELPTKLLHALEVAGSAADGALGVRPTLPQGTVGASPAATAAWLGTKQPADSGRAPVRYLESVADEYGGPVPCAVPLDVFERAQVIATFSRAGIPVKVSTTLRAGLTALLGPSGSPGGAGLPPDADTSSILLFALSQLGAEPDLECLWPYELSTHFCTWPGEDNPSPSANAHVLEILAAADHPPTITANQVRRYGEAGAKLTSWLLEQQRDDGSWQDRWHASPLYATQCCTLALARTGAPTAASAVGKAVSWVLATQRPDGSWGRWNSTAEETAYALQILLLTGSQELTDTVAHAAARGHRFLQKSAKTGHEALWHDKDLYAPQAIVEAAVLASTHLAETHPAVVRAAARL